MNVRPPVPTHSCFLQKMQGVAAKGGKDPIAPAAMLSAHVVTRIRPTIITSPHWRAHAAASGKKEPPATAAQAVGGRPRRGEETTRPYPTLCDKDISQTDGPATEEEALCYTLD